MALGRLRKAPRIKCITSSPGKMSRNNKPGEKAVLQDKGSTHPFEEFLSLRAPVVAQTVTNLPAMQETQVRSLGGKDPLEKELANQSSILAWRTPWTEEPERLPSMESQRVGQHRKPVSRASPQTN